MCLGIPARVKEWLNHDPLHRQAIVEIGAISQACYMACVPEAKIGDYVIVHAGIAICVIDAESAELTLRELNSAATNQTFTT